MADYDVNSVWQMVERVAKAGADTATDAEREAFSWLQTTLGLRRSPERYARRTRVRYRGATKRGMTATEVNKAEYRARKAKTTKPKFKTNKTPQTYHHEWNVIMDAIDKRNSYFNQSYEIDEEDIRNAVLCWGYDTVLERIEQEIVSARNFALDHNIEPGHGYWYGNRTMQPFGTIRVPPEKSPYANEWGDLPDLDGTTIVFGNEFYFYHGTMARR